MEKDLSILQPAQLSWREDGAPEASRFGDVYFSVEGGLAESQYVFLRHNGLPERFRHARMFTIAETGFGTGLNCLLAAHLWRQHAPANAELHLISFEKHPLTLSDLQRAHAAWSQLKQEVMALQAGYPPLLPGWHRIQLAESVTLWLWFGDVHDGLADLDTQVDAWFLDGFAPAKNPDMWTDALFQAMARLSHAGTTFATFTAAGGVRRGLQAAGFQVEKVPGFGRKREMLCGRFEGEEASAPAPKPKTLAVIGAGLAGATVAHEAAKAGVEVTVFEGQAPANGASGNRAGIFHPLITADWSLRSQWYQLALETLLGRLPQFLQAGVEGALSPVLHWPVDEKWRQRFNRFAQRFPHSGMGWEAAPCGKEQVWRYGQSGWLSPPTWAKHLLTHPGVSLRQQQVTLNAQQPLNIGGRSFDAVVVASGAHLPEGILWPEDMLRPVAGQVDIYSGRSVRQWMPQPWVHSGYSVAVSDTEVVSGATFVKHHPFDVMCSDEATEENKMRIAQVCPPLAATMAPVQARVSVRPTTRDHMPIVGVGVAQAALGVSLGHGARGIVSTLMSAQWVLNQLGVVSLPQFARLVKSVAPHRFRS